MQADAPARAGDLRATHQPQPGGQGGSGLVPAGGRVVVGEGDDVEPRSGAPRAPAPPAQSCRRRRSSGCGGRSAGSPAKASGAASGQARGRGPEGQLKASRARRAAGRAARRAPSAPARPPRGHSTAHSHTPRASPTKATRSVGRRRSATAGSGARRPGPSPRGRPRRTSPGRRPSRPATRAPSPTPGSSATSSRSAGPPSGDGPASATTVADAPVRSSPHQPRPPSVQPASSGSGLHTGTLALPASCAQRLRRTSGGRAGPDRAGRTVQSLDMSPGARRAAEQRGHVGGALMPPRSASQTCRQAPERATVLQQRVGVGHDRALAHHGPLDRSVTNDVGAAHDPATAAVEDRRPRRRARPSTRATTMITRRVIPRAVPRRCSAYSCRVGRPGCSPPRASR